LKALQKLMHPNALQICVQVARPQNSVK